MNWITKKNLRSALFLIFFSVSLLYPENVKTPSSSGKYIQVEWEIANSAVEYVFQISDDKKFFKIIFEQKIKNTSLRMPLENSWGEKLFGRVAGLNKFGIKGKFSEIFPIEVMVVDAPKKVENKLQYYPKDDKKFVSRNLSFQLFPEDSVPGEIKTYYKVNNGNWSTYHGGFTLSKEGENLLTYYSEDRAGNKEGYRYESFYLDTTPPEISYDFSPVYQDKEKIFYSGPNTRISLKANDAGSGVKTLEYAFILSRSEPPRFTGLQSNESITVPPEFSGKNIEFKIRSSDNLGNEKETGFFLIHDTTLPEVRILTSAVENRYLKQNSFFEFTASDQLSGLKFVKYSINNGPFEFYAEPIQLTQEGKFQLTILAADNSGNERKIELPEFVVLGKPK
ncbi:MAG: hypothetical protein K8R21_00090, partial [Leptospira sp.]|nr:hypothetical protein [Leptospira sp.]